LLFGFDIITKLYRLSHAGSRLDGAVLQYSLQNCINETVTVMSEVIDVLHNLARQRGRNETSPLLAFRSLPGREGMRISHVPISQQLAQAWITLTGMPFYQHQSLAVSAQRRCEPFVLVDGGDFARRTLHLLLAELLINDADNTALLLVPDEESLRFHLSELRRLAHTLNGASGGVASPSRVLLHCPHGCF
jgi:hypothetical protein